MRTLRKAVCLVLVAVMVMGFGAFSVSAVDNLASFSDGSSVSDTYKQAIDLLVGIQVVEGMDDGTLNLTGQYTREQAATIVARIKLGVTNANNLRCVSAPFTDVAADRWSAGAIAYCAQANILDGMGDGTFHPTEPLTGYAFGKMLLCAVGYGQRDEYVGPGWEINVAKDGVKRSIYSNADLGAATNEAITRQQAMLMAYNTLVKTKVVKYSTLINDYVSVNSNVVNSTVTSGSVDETFLMKDNFRNIFLARGPVAFDGNDHYIVQNKTYAKDNLPEDDKWITEYHANVADIKVAAEYNDVGRVSQVWFNRNGKDNAPEAITGSHMVDVKLGSRNDGTPLKDLILRGNKFIAELESANNDDTSISYFLNGQVSSYGEINLFSDWRGVEVTLYDSNSNNKADVVVAFARTVSKLTSAPVVSKDGKTITLGGTQISSRELNKVRGYEGLAKDDRVLFVMDADEVYHLEKARTITGNVTRFNRTDGILYVGSDSYKVSELPGVDGNLFEKIVNEDGAQCTFYLDTCNNIIDYDKISTGAPNYVVLLDVAFNSTDSKLNPDVRNDVRVKLLKPDGTVMTVVLNRMVLEVRDYWADYLADTTNVTRIELKDIYANKDGKIVYTPSVKYPTGTEDLATRTDSVTDVFGEGGTRHTFQNRFFTYTVGANDKYTLTLVENQDSDVQPLNAAKAIVRNGYSEIRVGTSTYYANNATTYIYWVPSANTYRVVTGVNSAPASKDGARVTVMNNNRLLSENSNLATLVFITNGAANDSGTKYFFPSADPLANIADDGSTSNINEKGVVYNVLNTSSGKIEEMILSEDAARDVYGPGWYNVTKGGSSFPDGYATAVDLVEVDKTTDRRAPGVGIYTTGNGIMTMGRYDVMSQADQRFNTTYAYTDDVKVYVVDPENDYDLSIGGKELLATDINDIIFPTSVSTSKLETAKEFIVVKVAEPKINVVNAIVGEEITFEVKFSPNDLNANYGYYWTLTENGSVVDIGVEDDAVTNPYKQQMKLIDWKSNEYVVEISGSAHYKAKANCTYNVSLYLMDFATGVDTFMTARQRAVDPT